ncbi:hypothetical protein P153DRAFT_382358 [Dothidotthia symphoricarpi CBS 119687]|uniref:Uncharacterized protein n=1 Tax=Dothidotthia symphoricarpi CBS 119687 TaxID=1392245 RepID=A0A6A6AME3_9PLEO|nr:uncharacterized protein P153DRAFT_382358 [Dothidotthia symphoricarpi CBS 119687]KAF2132736.1 hypothetical protein P153DRAFT_382358 [Dothidotthia symphoricarpi CBS 119687]
MSPHKTRPASLLERTNHKQQLDPAEAKFADMEKTSNTTEQANEAAKKRIYNLEKRVWHGIHGDAFSAEEMQLAVKEPGWDVKAPLKDVQLGASNDAYTILHSIRRIQQDLIDANERNKGLSNALEVTTTAKADVDTIIGKHICNLMVVFRMNASLADKLEASLLEAKRNLPFSK